MTAPDEPQRIVAALVAAGWRVAATGGTAVWLGWPGGTLKTAVGVSTDMADPGYGRDVDAVVATLGALDAAGAAARKVLAALTAAGVIV